MHIKVNISYLIIQMKTFNVSQFYNEFCCYFKSICFNFDKVIKLFTLSCLHPILIIEINNIFEFNILKVNWWLLYIYLDKDHKGYIWLCFHPLDQLPLTQIQVACYFSMLFSSKLFSSLLHLIFHSWKNLY
jgi:hypothetical protein